MISRLKCMHVSLRKSAILIRISAKIMSRGYTFTQLLDLVITDGDTRARSVVKMLWKNKF